MRTIKIIIHLFIILALIGTLFMSISCQHVIQLLEEDTINEEEEKMSGFDEIMEAAKDPNTLIVLVPTGIEAQAAREVSSEFDKANGTKSIIVEDSVWKIKDIFNFEVHYAKAKGIVDIAFYPDYFINESPSFFYNINEKIEKDSFDTSDFLFNEVSKWKEDQTLGLPVKYSFSSIIYRSDIFLSSNIILEKKWDYKQYNQILEKIGSNNLTENAISFDPALINMNWVNRYWSLGGLTLSNNWEVILNNEKAYKAVEMLKIMQNYSSRDLINKSYDEITSDFINGKSSIFEGYPDFLFTKYEDLLSSNFNGLFNLQTLPGEEGGNFSQLNYMLVGIHASSLKKDKAWEWIKLYTSKEKSMLFLDKYGMLPVRKSTYENEGLNNKYEFLKNIYDLLKNTEFRTVPKISASYYLWEDGLNKELKKGLDEDSTPQEIIKEIEKKWNNILLMKKPHKEFNDEEI